ncbi:MAG: hypothetical protein ACRBFS_22505 [Aureispira sp.]
MNYQLVWFDRRIIYQPIAGWMTLFLCFFSEAALAQNAYDHWVKSKELATHLRYEGTYRSKETYKSPTGKRKDFKLVQQQYYEAGYLREDVLYTTEQGKLYHVRFELPAPHTWEALAQKGGAYLAGVEMVGRNLMDSSTTTYSFDDSGRLKYYVVDNQGSLHTVYTYGEEGQLLRYKDCLVPFDNAYWCAYYLYEYNDQQQLSKALSYNLGQDQTPDQKALYAIDSMVYNDRGLLIERWTLDSARVVTQKAIYSYNTANQLCEEHSSQWPLSTWTRSYKKTYCYRTNGQPKKQQDAYYFGNQLEIRQERLYNRQGALREQATYKQGKQPISLYQLRYK